MLVLDVREQPVQGLARERRHVVLPGYGAVGAAGQGQLVGPAARLLDSRRGASLSARASARAVCCTRRAPGSLTPATLSVSVVVVLELGA